MKMVKRWGVMALVALLVLGTMGAALANEGETETETAKAPLLPGDYEPDLVWPEDLEWVDGLVQFVFYWGSPEGEEAECDDPQESASTTGTGLFGIYGGPTVTDEVPAVCVPLNVEKNGHVNHGSMVSSVVHWLKDGNLEDVLETLDDETAQKLRDMPKGQLVKMFAQNDFGKGNFVFPDLDDTLEAAEVEAEESDGHGPPARVLEKKTAKAAAKAAKKADNGKNE